MTYLSLLYFAPHKPHFAPCLFLLIMHLFKIIILCILTPILLFVPFLKFQQCLIQTNPFCATHFSNVNFLLIFFKNSTIFINAIFFLSFFVFHRIIPALRRLTEVAFLEFRYYLASCSCSRKIKTYHFIVNFHLCILI